MADNKQPVAAPVSRPKVRPSATPSRTDATRTVQRQPIVPAGVSAAKPIAQGSTSQPSARNAMLLSPPQSPVAPQSRVAVSGSNRAPHAGHSSVAASHHKNEATFPRSIQFDYTKFLNGILPKLKAKLEASLRQGHSTDYDGKDGLNETALKLIAITCLQSLPELQDWEMTSELHLGGDYADLILRHGNKAALVIELKYVRAPFVRLYLRSGQWLMDTNTATPVEVPLQERDFEDQVPQPAIADVPQEPPPEAGQQGQQQRDQQQQQQAERPVRPADTLLTVIFGGIPRLANVVVTSYVLARFYPTTTDLATSTPADAPASNSSLLVIFAADADAAGDPLSNASASSAPLACDRGLAPLLALDVAFVALQFILWAASAVYSARRARANFGTSWIALVRVSFAFAELGLLFPASGSASTCKTGDRVLWLFAVFRVCLYLGDIIGTCNVIVAHMLKQDMVRTRDHYFIYGGRLISLGYLAAISYFTILYDTASSDPAALDSAGLACEQNVPSFLYFALAVEWSEVTTLASHAAIEVASIAFGTNFETYKLAYLPLATGSIISWILR
ncbi:hypothetical protein HK405_009639, partial [Cladochytrium tenue]